MDYVHKRGNVYQYRRRVPEEVRHLDTRTEIVLSLKTKDVAEAHLKADIYTTQFDKFWKALIISGQALGVKEKYQAAVKLAKAQGFAYKTTSEIAETSSVGEILERLSLPIESNAAANALLGGADVPKIKLSDCPEQYWPLCIRQLQDKNDHQRTKWINPKAASMKNFIEVVGDKAIQDVTRDDTFTFRRWWVERINDGGMSPDTANKQFMSVKSMIKEVALQNNVPVDIEVLFADIKLPKIDNPRPPFEAEYVQNVLLPALKNTNEDARYVMMIMADTGMRDSEVLTRCADDIRLDEKIPYVWVRPNAKTKRLKTKTSNRKIPLVGNALHAFQQRPNGFDRWNNIDSFSSAANKFLRVFNLKPDPRNVVYSLRHTYKDRLRSERVEEEIIDELMGHKKRGQTYGHGYSLKVKYEVMKKIAFKVVK